MLASFTVYLFFIAGTGLSLPDRIFLGSLPNNSAVVFNREESRKPQELLCHSALPSNSCAGEWLGVNNTPPSERCSGGRASSLLEDAVFSSVKLDLHTVSEEGVYTCIIDDEDQMEQRHYVGIYHNGNKKLLV